MPIESDTNAAGSAFLLPEPEHQKTVLQNRNAYYRFASRSTGDQPALTTFQTDRLFLRPRVLADLDDCLAMDRDPFVLKYISGPWDDPVKHRAFVLERMNTAYPEGQGYWSVFERNETHPPAFAGWMILIPYPEFDNEAEIGWRLKRDFWGKGYASEAARPMLRYAFETLGLKGVVAEIHPENTGSISVAEKLGLRLARQRVTDGEPVSSYRLGREDYFRLPDAEWPGE